MNHNNLDRILEAKELVNGLVDTIYTIRTAQQDDLVPLTILIPFEVALKKVYSLLEDVEKNPDN